MVSIVILIISIVYNKILINNNSVKFYYSTLDKSIFLETIGTLSNWEYTNNIYEASLIHTKDKVSRKNLNPNAMISRIKGLNIIGDKAKFYNIMKNYSLLNNNDFYKDYLPKTYDLNNISDCSLFLNLYINIEKLKLNNNNNNNNNDNNVKDYWLLKPTCRSQGDGIKIFSIKDYEFITNNIVKNIKLVNNSMCTKPMKNFIIQKYINNLLLLNERKMEIRAYVLIASVDPLIVYYHDGIIRLNSEKYTQSDWNNPLIHITNIKQQKMYNSKYNELKQDLKWSTDQFQKYLFNNYNNLVKNDDKYYDNIIRPKLNYLISNIINSSIDILDKRHGYYQFIGIDFIMTDNLDLFITEVQSKPGLRSDNKYKEIIMKEMILDMIEIINFIQDYNTINKNNNYNNNDELFYFLNNIKNSFSLLIFDNKIYHY